MKKRIKSRQILALLSVLCLLWTVPEQVMAKEHWPRGPKTESKSVIVMEVNTGTVLYEKKSHQTHYPASITKIMTTLLAIENCDLNEEVIFSDDAVYESRDGSSSISRQTGEKMTMEQCLYAVMLESANECAYAVAEHVAGDIDSFIQMMNERAAKIGCQNTHFNNCNGLPDEQHYTSAYDMALIAREAYQNETFRIICGTKTYTIPFTNKHTDEETYLQNHHQMLYPYRTRKYLYDYCLGGKTGYTTAANNTLVTYAEKNGMTLICVVLDAPAGGHYEDTRGLFDFCFDNFKEMNISENETSFTGQKQEKEGILNDYEPFVMLNPSSNIILPIAAEFTDAVPEIVYNEETEDVLGSICYTYGDRQVGSADITVTNAEVEGFSFQKGDDNDSHVIQDENQKEDAPEKEETYQIDIKTIAIIFFGILGIAAVIFLIWKFIDNFYLIKRKLPFVNKDKSPYKTIKENKMYRKKRRRWF